MKILILGSRGVIGKSLCNLLKKDDDEEKHEICEWDLEISESHDLRSSEKIPDMSEYDFIFFLAYDIGGSKYLKEQQIDFINNNLKIMVNVFTELGRVKKPFIFASSQMSNMDNPYGLMKRLGEHYTSLLSSLSVKFWNVYGPEEIGLKSHVISDFLDQFNRTGSIKLMTTGNECRQFLHTEDCARALKVCMKYYDQFKINKNYIDITSFEWTKIVDLAFLISDDVVIGSVVDNVQTKHNEPDPFILDYWKPVITLKEGLKMI